MINWFNMPAEGLSNGGQFEIKELTATENGEYQKDGEVYNKVTVNVSGGGGGGSSDFSTAEVTITSDDEYVDGLMINYISENGVQTNNAPDVGTYDTVLYKGKGNAYKLQSLHKTLTVTGDAQYDSMFGIITITGDCTIDVRIGG